MKKPIAGLHIHIAQATARRFPAERHRSFVWWLGLIALVATLTFFTVILLNIGPN